jgi:hypothetical protein
MGLPNTLLAREQRASPHGADVSTWMIFFTSENVEGFEGQDAPFAFLSAEL